MWSSFNSAPASHGREAPRSQRPDMRKERAGRRLARIVECRRESLTRARVHIASGAKRTRSGDLSSSSATPNAAISAVLAASPFYGEDHRKIWARLRAAGPRTSLR